MDQDPKKLTRAHKIALGIISLACCCIIGISAFALAAPDAVSELTSQQTGQAAEQAQQQNAGASEESASTKGNEANESDGEESSSSQGNGGSSTNGSSNSGSSNGNGSGGGNSSPQGDNSSSGSGQSSGGASSGGSSSSQGSTDSGTVTVSVSIHGSANGVSVSGSAHPTFEKGASAYDALCATGLSVITDNRYSGIWVVSIGGLRETNGSNGWTYYVNGSMPMMLCDKYKLKDGDSVTWEFVEQ